MPISKILSSGSIPILILKLLSEKDMYGYEMIETLRSRSMNVFEMKAGTLYPLLHGMEEQGFLTAYEKPAGGKTRKYYHLTQEGNKELQNRLKDWERYSEAMSRVLLFS